MLAGQGQGGKKDVVAAKALGGLDNGQRGRGMGHREGQCGVPFLGEVEDMSDELEGEGR